ncbi:MAG: hypothetical protein HRU40_01835 [Saprospiraceae bacterium]|nr:hypothetical protein [Saprospiraceae bacterium]
MYQNIAAKNARRNRFRAIFLTTAITMCLLAALVYSSSTELQALVTSWIDQVMGLTPTPAPQP